MSTLIASIDSDIGAALKRAVPEAHGTSRLGVGDYHLDIVTANRFQTSRKYNRLFYTIAAENPRSGLEVFEVNAFASFNWLDYAASELLNNGAQVVVLGSQRGSIAEVQTYNMPYYRMSKAALHMGVKLLSKKWPNLNWLVMHPGLVATKMTEKHSYDGEKISPDESAARILRHSATNPSFGFYGISGRAIPW